MADTFPFAEWLRSLRDEDAVPLRIVAAAVGIDSTLLSKLECGDRLPTDPQAAALAKHYEVPVEDMRTRLLAARILHDYGSDPALTDAISRVREETGKMVPIATNSSHKQIRYSARKRSRKS